MGLGPPVCTKCMKIMKFHQNILDEARHVYWKCGCGVTGNDPECNHLFCLSKENYNKALGQVENNVEIVEECDK